MVVRHKIDVENATLFFNQLLVNQIRVRLKMEVKNAAIFFDDGDLRVALISEQY